MHPFITALALLLTIGAGMSLGIVLGYAVLGAILRAMRHPQPAHEHALAATQASSGD